MSADLDALAVEGTACPYCGAQPGEWCVTARPYFRAPGYRAPHLHEDRGRLLREAWRLGNRNGWVSALESTIGFLRAARKGEAWAVRNGVPRLTSDAVERWLAGQRERWQ